MQCEKRSPSMRSIGTPTRPTSVTRNCVWKQVAQPRRWAVRLLSLWLLAGSIVFAEQDPSSLVNRKSGISVSLSGINGIDWAVEHGYHDPSLGDQIIYLKSHVHVSLAHNERNSVTHNGYPQLVIGIDGADGVAGSGDEGDIYWKIDRDLLSHRYSTRGGAALPEFCARYTEPISFETLTYDGSERVLGAVGNNGGQWGESPLHTTKRWAFGQHDAFGNQWHTLTYWDDDERLLSVAGIDSHRQGASDGHCIWMCVNPVTPILQLQADDNQQFYTTPIKTYFVPKIWAQTSYVTSGVRLHFVNLTDDQPSQYRVADGTWQTYQGTALPVTGLFGDRGKPVTIEYRCGPSGSIASRSIVVDPEYTAREERHGFMLWADEAGRQSVIARVTERQPFKKSYETWRSGLNEPRSVSDVRGIWRSTAGSATRAQAEALLVALEGAESVPLTANNCKSRLLRLARLQPLGTEYNINSATPAKDFLNELGQTIQQLGDAAIAYDLLAAHFRSDRHAGGITPIEEIWIRDGLGKVAKSILQMRANWSAISGAGDTHWSHGYDLAVQLIAMAMPTYKTPYYGVSGADGVSRNDKPDSKGEYWNPYPYQGETWFDIATNPAIDTPGHPGVRYPIRAEFLLTDDGWWTGPNNLVGDGTRYFAGAMRRQLVDVKHGGLANAQCRVELVEMHGYESPFVGRAYLVDHVRRLKGLRELPMCAKNYLRRRLMMGGPVDLRWDSESLTYAAEAPKVTSALRAFNRSNNFASLPTPRTAVAKYLEDLNAYYGFGGDIDEATRTWMHADGRKALADGVTLVLCEDPDDLPPHREESNHPPIVKPMFKHVVRPGETIRKDLIVVDLDDDEMTITVEGLPQRATFAANHRRITWAPSEDDLGVHIAHVTVSDGKSAVTRPFPMIVNANAPSGAVPTAPRNVTARPIENYRAVQVAWEPPEDVTVAAYVVYREGALWAVTPPNVTTFTDREWIEAGQHTRYHVALYDETGCESIATESTPPYVSLIRRRLR